VSSASASGYACACACTNTGVWTSTIPGATRASSKSAPDSAAIYGTGWCAY